MSTEKTTYNLIPQDIPLSRYITPMGWVSFCEYMAKCPHALDYAPNYPECVLSITIEGDEETSLQRLHEYIRAAYYSIHDGVCIMVQADTKNLTRWDTREPVKHRLKDPNQTATEAELAQLTTLMEGALHALKGRDPHLYTVMVTAWGGLLDHLPRHIASDSRWTAQVFERVQNARFVDVRVQSPAHMKSEGGEK